MRHVGSHRERHTGSVLPARDVPDTRQGSKGGSRKENKQIFLAKSIVLVSSNRGRNNGSHQKDDMDFLSYLGRRITRSIYDHIESAFLFQRLSVLIQRYNAVAVFGTFTHTTSEDEM